MKSKQLEVRLPGRKTATATWNIVPNLTDRWGDITDLDADNKPLEELQAYDGVLLKALQSQMWDEATFVAQKDGKFGILYEVEFASKQSEEGHEDGEEYADHADVVNAIALRLEILSLDFPGVDFCVPPESEIANNRPAAWAYVAFGLLGPDKRESLGRSMIGLMTQVADFQMGITTIDVHHRNGHDESMASKGPEFEMQIIDQRKVYSQLYVDVAAKGGNVDDVMCAAFEISTLPGTSSHTQALHLHFDHDQLAMSIFKQGDQYILRPETGVSIESCTLDNGDHAFILK